MKYVLDTNICIYIIKNKFASIATKLSQIGFDQIGISVITIAELEYGVANSTQPEKSKDALLQFLLPFEIIDFDIDSAIQYGKIRKDLKKNTIGTMDMLIASIAIANELTLITNNEKEFRRITELKIENWTK